MNIREYNELPRPERFALLCPTATKAYESLRREDCERYEITVGCIGPNYDTKTGKITDMSPRGGWFVTQGPCSFAEGLSTYRDAVLVANALAERELARDAALYPDD